MKLPNPLYGLVSVAYGLFYVPCVVDTAIPELAHQYPNMHKYGVPTFGLVMGVVFALVLRMLIERLRKAD